MASKPLALKPTAAAPPQAAAPRPSAPTAQQQVVRPVATGAPRPVAAAAAPQVAAPRPVAAPQAAAPRPAAAAPPQAAAAAPQAQKGGRPPIIIDNVPYRLFSTKTRDAVDNLAILKDKVIKLDYWVPSLDKKCVIGVNKSGDKYLVLNDTEYTSKIQKCCAVAGTDDVVVETEYSIYIIAKGILTRPTTIGESDYIDGDEIM